MNVGYLVESDTKFRRGDDNDVEAYFTRRARRVEPVDVRSEIRAKRLGRAFVDLFVQVEGFLRQAGLEASCSQVEFVPFEDVNSRDRFSGSPLALGFERFSRFDAKFRFRRFPNAFDRFAHIKRAVFFRAVFRRDVPQRMKATTREDRSQIRDVEIQSLFKRL